MKEPTLEELAQIYKEVNNKSPVLTADRLFKAMRAAYEKGVEDCKEKLKTAATSYGNELNNAGWKFLDEYARLHRQVAPPPLFNYVKPMLEKTIPAFIDDVLKDPK